MSDSPLSASPYEILGVPSTASEEDIRRAYRRLARETHPDTGGDTERFIAVQRAWDTIGTASARDDFDRGRSGTNGEGRVWAPGGPARTGSSRPTARSHGHPGGWRRERYLRLVREWAGRGADLDDPYDAALVRSAPQEIRRLLADALAEEATARSIASLGMGFTVWHDVATGDPEEKVDHVVLGPTGLFALLSEDAAGRVEVSRGELVGDGLDTRRPMRALEQRAKVVARAARVKFSALLIVLPDEALESSFAGLGSSRGAVTAVVRRSALGGILRDGIPGTRTVGGPEIFDLRTRLAAAIRFV